MYLYLEKMIRHQRADRCNQATGMRLLIRDVELVQRAGEMNFSIYDREDDLLGKGLTQFQYLGRTLDNMDNEWPAFHWKFVKVRAV